ncbi:hypothetical protein [Nocardia sp. SC052]|uniref:hypothetical protein n=1 Tax=Nocardia sichangensis TaxID=3385975 RepID=UPI0039A04A36
MTDNDRITDRGFIHYGAGPIVTSTGMPATVDVSESSAAWCGSRTNPEGDSGPFMWLRVTSTYPDEDPHRPGKFLPLDKPKEATAHLNRAEAAELHARVGRWLNDPARVVLAVPMESNPAEAGTVGEYLAAVLSAVWSDGGNASGKRIFGESGWRTYLVESLARAWMIAAEFDDDGELKTYDQTECDRLMRLAITALTS